MFTYNAGNAGNVWVPQVAALTRGSTVKLRVTYVAGGSFTGDIALDNIFVL